MSALLEARRKRLVARQAIRAWEYRQRHAAKGVWPRLRRLLAEAELAAIVDSETAATLIAEGYQPQAIGRELESPRTILVLPRERFERIEGRRPVAVMLSAELLSATELVLVPFAVADAP